MRDARCFIIGALLGIGLVLMSEEEWAKPEEPEKPWDRPRPPLEGDEWMSQADGARDPEQGSQPDHAPPPRPFLPPTEQFKRLRAGPVTQRCPKCGGTDLRFDNALGFWCKGACQQAFSAPMNLDTAVICYAGFFDVRRAT